MIAWIGVDWVGCGRKTSRLGSRKDPKFGAGIVGPKRARAVMTGVVGLQAAARS